MVWVWVVVVGRWAQERGVVVVVLEDGVADGDGSGGRHGWVGGQVDRMEVDGRGHGHWNRLGLGLRLGLGMRMGMGQHCL